MAGRAFKEQLATPGPALCPDPCDTVGGMGHDKAWELIPLQSVGPLRFGMAREGVIALVGEPQFTVQSERDSRLGYDQYQTFRAGYDRDQRLMNVECNRSQPVSYQDWMLTGTQAGEVEAWAKGHGLKVKWTGFHDRSMLIPELCLSLWVPEDDLAPPNSILFVLAARQDYWQLVPEPQESPFPEDQ
jgi:hypothetical protein